MLFSIDRTEFEQIIMSDDLLQLCSSSEIVNKLTSIDSAVIAMVGFDQRNPHHCYDLWNHTLHTVINITGNGINPYNLGLLKIAAFFHDIGKTVTAKEKEGRLVFYGHAGESATLMVPILKRLGYTESEINRITFYVANHDMFISFVLPTDDYDKDNPYLREINKSNIVATITTISSITEGFTPEKSDYLCLLRLCLADAKSQADKVHSQDGKVIESKKHKLAKLTAIMQMISSLPSDNK